MGRISVTGHRRRRLGVSEHRQVYAHELVMARAETQRFIAWCVNTFHVVTYVFDEEGVEVQERIPIGTTLRDTTRQRITSNAAHLSNGNIAVSERFPRNER